MTDYPTFDLDLAVPGVMGMPTVEGGAIMGGRAQSGARLGANTSGGGLVTVSYEKIILDNASPESLRYWSRLGLMLNPGVRSILVPLMNDYLDMKGWTATLNADAAVNAGTVTLIIAGTGMTDTPPLKGGEWFGLPHDLASNRVYGITDIDSIGLSGSNWIATVGITPPIRQAASSGLSAIFWRPLCLMQLKDGSQISAKIQPGWIASPDVQFIESSEGLDY